MMGSQLMYSKGYSWSHNDLLGKGAFGQVFKGFDQKTGQAVAIKTFEKPIGRKQEVEVLRKIRHKNIVEYYANETSQSGCRIIVMELCNAGNLHSMLEEPENKYGFEESDFKLMLEHITSGMHYLHENKIVHRDLKPGNIMRTIKSDGEVIYKLTDFGAARELKDTEQQFSSLVGTQEYLHPDMYAAYMKRPTTSYFHATIDLWSLGVTLYHLATGSLPFKPYGGVRSNNEGMISIIKQKPSGSISGIQQSKDINHIAWSENLPKTTRFCQSFREEIEAIIKGILESDTHRIWTFERYFHQVDCLLKKKIVHVFAMSSSVYHQVYINNNDNFMALKDQIEHLFNIPRDEQIFLYDGMLFECSMTSLIDELPLTSLQQPFVVMTSNLRYQSTVPIPHTCKPPKIRLHTNSGNTDIVKNYENDHNLAKVCASTLYNIQKTVTYLLNIEQMIRLSIKWFISYLKNRVLRTKIGFWELTNYYNQIKTTLSDFEEHYRRESAILKPSSIGGTLEVNGLTSYFTDIQNTIKDLREIEKQYNETRNKLEKVDYAVLIDDIPKSIFVDDINRTSYDPHKYECRMKSLANCCKDIYAVFRKHKQIVKRAATSSGNSGGGSSTSRISTHEETVHKSEKKRLHEICDMAVKLFTTESVRSCKNLHKETNVWFSNVSKYDVILNEIDGVVTLLTDECVVCSNKLRSIQKSYRERHQRIVVIMKQSNQFSNNINFSQNQQMTITTTNNDDNDVIQDGNDVTDHIVEIQRDTTQPQQYHDEVPSDHVLDEVFRIAMKNIQEINVEIDQTEPTLIKLERFNRHMGAKIPFEKREEVERINQETYNADAVNEAET